MHAVYNQLAFIFRPFRSRGLVLVWLVIGATLVTGCTMNLRNQPKYKPLAEADFFPDGRSARPLVAHTVAQGHLQIDKALYEGKNEDGSFVDTFPFEITPEILARGQERYNIYCSPCHSSLGDGQGMIVQRGFKQPPSFHIGRLRDAPVGYYYDVIANGFGTMYSYASRVGPEDRWAIIAYIRALQLSQNATLTDVPPGEREKLMTGPEQ